jgi:myo-inositol-1(or 4)-monophosphatase
MGDVAALMDEAVAAVREAGAIARRYFRTRLRITNKLSAGFDPVTQADTEIEMFLRERLARIAPGLGIAGEEFGATGSARDYWIIDPIDGTRAFMSGMPTWGILLGLVLDGKAVGGVMHQPFTGEMFVGDAENGSRLLHAGETVVLRGSDCRDLGEAVLYSTDPVMLGRGGILAGFERLAEACRLRRFGGDCYAFSLVALGTIELMVEGDLAPYDIVPLIAVIEGAGGKVTTLAGESPLGGGNVVGAGNGWLHERALGVLTGLAE